MGESACVMQPLPVIPTEAIEGDPLRGLNDSISFGRFAPESLSWEKWSTFSHKKYVEEAERYSKPGSVAEKKAFFEAHYKKMASLKAAGLLEQANNAGLDSVTVPSKSQDTGNNEPKDHTKKENTLPDGGVKEGDLVSKEEENDTRKDGGGDVNLNEQGRNPHEQKQDAQMETPPPKDLVGSLPSSSSDMPLQKKRTRFVTFMGGSRSKPRTKETTSKRKEDKDKDKAETKWRSWSRCFCFGEGQLEDRPNLPTDKVAAASTAVLNGTNSNIQQQRLETRGVSTSLG